MLFKLVRFPRWSQLIKFSVVITMVLAFLFLHERVDAKTVIGGILITAGTLVMIL